ncbi:hypothetical protein EW026_g7648 [Hermanssonia centrifuga]|uniref:Uncharacterized protein n=1 Tax=Hermanssonia centrifuga TaxID=98765 RepID=A0A4V3X9D2_9APHY|nr:hypothetical protein EW026_g7648 [Hermanssonia centrifuga]
MPQSLLSSSDRPSALQTPPSTPGSTVSYWHEKMLAYRAELINNSVYLGDAAVDVEAQLCWIRVKKKSILCTVEALKTYEAERAAYNNDITNIDPPSVPEPVTLSAVWRIDEEYFFMTADGNWNPKKDFGGFESSKATCLMAQANEAVFAADHERIVRNITKLVEMGVSGDGRPVKGIFGETPDNRTLIKLRHVLFHLKTDDDDGETGAKLSADSDVDSDEAYGRPTSSNKVEDPKKKQRRLREEEFTMVGWPVRRKEAKATMKNMKGYYVSPIPAFKMVGDAIRPSTYEASLKGADVGVHFNLLHWPIGDVKYPKGLLDTFVGDLVNMRVYAPPKEVFSSSPTKRDWQKDRFTPDVSPSKVRRLL